MKRDKEDNKLLVESLVVQPFQFPLLPPPPNTIWVVPVRLPEEGSGWSQIDAAISGAAISGVKGDEG